MKKTVIALMLAGSTAHACPTAADLATGIVLFESGTDNGQQVFSTLSDALVLHASTYPDGFGYRNELVHGTYVSKTASTDNGRVDRYSVLQTNYAQSLASIPVPAVGVRWRASTTIASSDETYDESQVVNWGNETTYTVGDCTYPMVPGTIRYNSKYGKTLEELYYLPTLGFSLLVGYQTDNGPKDVYGFRDIAAVK